MPDWIGKTLAYLVPAIEKLQGKPPGEGVAALIIAPTRDLALQVRTAIRQTVMPTEVLPQIEAQARRLLGGSEYSVRRAVGGTEYAYISCMVPNTD